jgi:hypothetical protein
MEMEIPNMFMSLAPEEVSRLLSMYASSETNRQNVVSTILNAEDPLNIERIETIEENHNRETLDSLMKCVGVALID